MELNNFVKIENTYNLSVLMSKIKIKQDYLRKLFKTYEDLKLSEDVIFNSLNFNIIDITEKLKSQKWEE